MKRLGVRDLVNAVLAAVVAHTVYMITLAPTVTSEDSGEFVAAAWCGGVPHPPGFPLWCLLARLFCQLPMGDPAWRCNLLSAVFGSLTIGLLYLVCRQLGARAVAAFAAALCVAFSRHFWSQAVIAEVYTLNTFFFCASLLTLLVWSEVRKDRLLYLFALTFGLSLGNHYMLMLVVAPPIFAYMFWTDRGIFKKAKVILISLGIIALCQLSYLYLYFAAQNNPAMNWGDPSSMNKLVDHINRTSYKKVEQGAQDVSFSIKVMYAFDFLRLLWQQFTPYLLLLAAAPGLFLARRKDRIGNVCINTSQWYMLVGVFFFNVVPLILLLNYRFEAEFRTRFEEYYLPAYCVVAIFASIGLSHFLAALASAGKFRKVIALVLVSLTPLLPLATHWKSNDMSDYYLAYDYNKAIIESLEENAIYFTGGDYSSFPPAYLQVCLKIRPDILLADITGDISKGAQEYMQGLDPDVDLKDRVAFQKVVIEKGQRPVFFTAKSDIKDMNAYQVVPYGLVYRVALKSDKDVKGLDDFFETDHLRNLETETVSDDMGLSIQSNYYLMQAEHHAFRKNRQEAIASYAKAAEYGKDSKEALNNIGGTCAEKGYTREAERYLVKAARSCPGYLTPLRNLAKLYEANGRIHEALRTYEELSVYESENASLLRVIANLKEELQPKKPGRPKRDLDSILKDYLEEARQGKEVPSLYNNIGNVYAEKGDALKAMAAYRKAVKMDPNYYRVYRNMSLLYRDVLKDEGNAKRYMERYDTLKRKHDHGATKPE